MAAKTMNQIYSKWNPENKKFTDWITDWKNVYKTEKPTAKDPFADEGKKDFEVWMNKKYRSSQLKKISGITETGLEFLKDVGDKVLQKKEEDKEIEKQQTELDKNPPKMKFLGLPKGVVIVGGLIIVAAIGYGIYKIIKKNKSKLINQLLY